MLFNYFYQLFSVQQDQAVEWLDILSSTLTLDQYQPLNAPILDEDIKVVLFSMAPWKTPGPNDFPLGFFQHYWNRLRPNIFAFVHQCFTGIADLGKFNSTCITLIPKHGNPLYPFERRPIGLCNTIYKIIAKLICNRLKPIMPHILEMNQGTFTKGGPVDNACVVLEILHSIITKDRRLSNGKTCLAIKLIRQKRIIDLIGLFPIMP